MAFSARPFCARLSPVHPIPLTGEIHMTIPLRTTGLRGLALLALAGMASGCMGAAPPASNPEQAAQIAALQEQLSAAQTALAAAEGDAAAYRGMLSAVALEAPCVALAGGGGLDTSQCSAAEKSELSDALARIVADQML